MNTGELTAETIDQITPETGTGGLLRNTIVSMGLTVLTNGLLYAGQVMIIRTMPREVFSQFAVAVSFVALFSLFADLGLTPLLVKRIAEARSTEEQTRIFFTAFVLRFSIAILVSFVLIGVALNSGYPETQRTSIVILSLSLFISSRLLIVRAVPEALLRAVGLYRRVALYALLDALTFAVLLWLAGDGTLRTTTILYLLCNVPGFILVLSNVVAWLPKANLRLHVDLSLARELLITGVPLALGAGFITVHNEADKLLINYLSTPFQVSAFRASMTLLSALSFLPTVIGIIIAPAMARLASAGRHVDADRLALMSIRLLLILAGCVAICFAGGAESIISLVFGAKYQDDLTVRLVTMIAWGFLPIALNTLLLDIAVVRNANWLVTRYMLLIMLATLTGDLLLCGPYGATGGMIAKLGGLLLGSGYLLFALRRRALLPSSALVQIGRLCLACALPVLPYLVGGKELFTSPALVCISLVFYAAALWLLKLLNRADLYALGRSFDWRRSGAQ